MEYLNWNIKRVEKATLNREIIEKIAKMRASEYERGESSIGGIVSFRVFQPDYSTSISYSQEGNYDNYSKYQELEIQFGRENIFDSLQDISYNEKEGKYWDSYNKEFYTFEDLVDLVVENGSPSLIESTEEIIKNFIEELKKDPERCSHCESTDIIKHGKERHADGLHQRWICKTCNHMSTSEWVF